MQKLLSAFQEKKLQAHQVYAFCHDGRIFLPAEVEFLLVVNVVKL